MNKSFDKKDIFSWANCEEAEEYIGKKGYFSNFISPNLVEWYLGTLSEITSLNSCRITKIFTNNKGESFGLFIPLEKVKEAEEEKKYRPFKAMWEFFNTVNKRMGGAIRIKVKTETIESVLLIDGFTETHSRELKYIFLSGFRFTPKELLENYEYFANGTWQPFGVLDKS